MLLARLPYVAGETKWGKVVSETTGTKVLFCLFMSFLFNDAIGNSYYKTWNGWIQENVELKSI
jgi:hypothetical protein